MHVCRIERKQALKCGAHKRISSFRTLSARISMCRPRRKKNPTRIKVVVRQNNRTTRVYRKPLLSQRFVRFIEWFEGATNIAFRHRSVYFRATCRLIRFEQRYYPSISVPRWNRSMHPFCRTSIPTGSLSINAETHRDDDYWSGLHGVHFSCLSNHMVRRKCNMEGFFGNQYVRQTNAIRQSAPDLSYRTSNKVPISVLVQAQQSHTATLSEQKEAIGKPKRISIYVYYRRLRKIRQLEQGYTVVDRWKYYSVELGYLMRIRVGFVKVSTVILPRPDRSFVGDRYGCYIRLDDCTNLRFRWWGEDATTPTTEQIDMKFFAKILLQFQIVFYLCKLKQTIQIIQSIISLFMKRS